MLADPHAGAIVVAHNILPSALDLPDSDRVEVVELPGHAGCPGAPAKFGVDAATAEWVGILDSDDWYEPGAIAAMRSRAQSDHADAVFAPFRKEGKRHKSLLPTMKTRNLDPVRDAIFYRTAPLGIFRRDLLQSAPFATEVSSGEDIPVGAFVSTSGASISFYWNDPAYISSADANDRVTDQKDPFDRIGAVWNTVWDADFVRSWDQATRHAFAVKMARVHIAQAIEARAAADSWREGEFEWMKNTIQRLRAEDPHFDRPLLARTARTIRSVESGDVDRLDEAFRATNGRKLPLNPSAVLYERDTELRWRMIEYRVRLREDRKSRSEKAHS